MEIYSLCNLTEWETRVTIWKHVCTYAESDTNYNYRENEVSMRKDTISDIK